MAYHHNDKLYRIFKTKYKFRNTILFKEPEKEPEPETEKYVDPGGDEYKDEEPERLMLDIEEEHTNSDIYYDLLDIFKKLRKNSKRRLEILIRKYKDNINELEDNEKQDLLDFINQKFFS